MELLLTACLAFLVTHLGISATPLRGKLQGLMGAKPYLGLYSLLAFGSLGLMVYGYVKVPHMDFLWYPSQSAYLVTKVLLLLSLVALVMGSLTKNPTLILNDAALDHDVSGMLKITRHPVQWAILLFAVGHLIANGDRASVAFFGTLALVSLCGMFSMDARRRQEDDPRWKSFMANTSMVPFAALVSGRQSLTGADINWPGLVAGLGLYAAVYWMHHLVSGGVSLFQ